jgi:phospholipase/carboxylesterase
MLRDEAFADEVAALGPPLLRALDAVSQAMRQLHPPALPSIRAALTQFETPLEAAYEHFASLEPVDELHEFHAQLRDATAHALAALQGFTQGGSGPEATAHILGAMHRHARAQAILFPLRYALPPVHQYFLEPPVRSQRPVASAPDSAEDAPRVGLLNAHNDVGERGGFSLYVPESYTGDPLPLVVALHGGGGHGGDFLYTWLREARSRGFLLLAPTSRGPTWALQGPDVDAPALDSMQAFVRERWAVDPERVLVTGLSDGATYSLLYGLREGAPCTHLAPISGVLHPANFGNGNLARARERPIYLAHGRLDWMFPIRLARAAAQELEGAGAALVFREIEDLSHTYPREENDAVLRWLDPGLALPKGERGTRTPDAF